MKKLFLAAGLLIFTVSLFSQNFTFTRISSEMVILSDSSAFETAVHSYAKINPNSGTQNITIIRTIEDLTPAWDTLGTSICNYNGCYSNTQDTIVANYNTSSADDTIAVYFYFRSFYYPYVLHGCGHVKLKAYITSNPAQFIELDFRACTPQTIGIKQISSIVKNFSLSQNYPNPFNPSTKINFAIPNSEHVSLRVYDLLGREVKVLVNESLTPGEYEIDFDGKNLSSGMYYYSLRAGEYVDVKKMVLVK